MAGKTLSANQLEFVNLIVDHLTNHGVMNSESLYESPFTDLTPWGPDEIFSVAQMEELLSVFENVRATAKA
jgi:type I restriction enzyme R subunit